MAESILSADFVTSPIGLKEDGMAEEIKLRGFWGGVIAVAIMGMIGAVFLVPLGFFGLICWAIISLVNHFCG